MTRTPVLSPETVTRRFGAEGSGSCRAALARRLEVPANLTERERRHLRHAGKTDASDALAIARVALREPGRGPVPMPGLAPDLTLLVVGREQRVAERTRVVNRLHARLVVLALGTSCARPAWTCAWEIAQEVLGRAGR